MDISPGKTNYWVPVCDNAIKPFVGQWFSKLDDGVEFYIRYARTVGFNVRRGSDSKNSCGEVLRKYLLCSREGFKQPAKELCSGGDVVNDPSISKKRRRVTNRVGCNAKIIFKLKGYGGYSVFYLEERHTHCLYSEASKPFMRINRKLDLGHQIFVANCAKANIGSIKSWKLYRKMVGDYTDVGATGVDFQNFKRDLMAYIRGGDAQLIVEKFLHKKELWSSFFFDYDVDEYDQLSRVFWADPVARRNFACFGDVVSFDATYRTNMYKLVFVPFTGIDNHKKSVTFAAGLIAKKDVESYVWLLDNFKRAMGHEPTYILTDQDPAMRVAIPTVFNSARHRFCMWHIMSKVGDKVGSVVAKDQSFRRALNDVVWD
ncbi:PREDICTED: protein FAR1-RELATED SEQUENCE 5-like [Ipomoea nil]|uniref:protein FAR1-RELATED SEQUENCE 5-like n=1 Tax=Ipomoea nil TaxID=35883 RepID=UPI00090159FC|nr:PREDICTED: protein FAR1-RELATED SEQUENCE 5-like [Ipomoea nil]